MSSTLVARFEKDLKAKVSQKQMPNLNEENTLIKFFKYFDLSSNGRCNFRDFVKTLEKIGVFFSKNSEIQDVFNNYDKSKSGFVDYREFSRAIFKAEDFDHHSAVHPHLKQLDKVLIERTGRGFLDFYKEFKIFDVNNLKKIGIDDFIKCFTNHQINISVYDIQLLFNTYESNQNGYFSYENMFKDLKLLYWSPNRGDMILTFFNTNDIQSIRDLSRLYAGQEKESFQDFADNYIFIRNLSIGSQSTILEDFQDFFMFFCYGVQNDEDVAEFLQNSFSYSSNKSQQESIQPKIRIETSSRDGNDSKKNGNKSYSFSSAKNKKQIITEDEVDTDGNFKGKKSLHPFTNYHNLMKDSSVSATGRDEISLLEKIRIKLSKLSRKNFLSIFKYFKSYDNGTKFIGKADFTKVMKDFRLNLTPTEIEDLYDSFCDKKTNLLNHKHFFTKQLLPELPDSISKLLGKVFDKLAKGADSIKLDLLLSLYCPKDHPIITNEDECMNDFAESFELYHYSYLMLDSEDLCRDEFEEFYRVNYFLLDRDSGKLERCILSEWKMTPQKSSPLISDTSDRKEVEVKEIKKQETKSKINKASVNYNILADSQQQQESSTAFAKTTYKYQDNKQVKAPSSDSAISPFDVLSSKLRGRGIRGLIFFHKELFGMQKLRKISQSEFLLLLNLQKLNIDKLLATQIFESYSKDRLYLDASALILKLKRPLVGKSLSLIEDIFSRLDVDNTGFVSSQDLRIRFTPNKHFGENLDAVSFEFLDSFEQSMQLMSNKGSNSDLVSFEDFANYYEYVQFVFPSEEKFCIAIRGSFSYSS